MKGTGKVIEKTMQTDTYLMLHSGTADSHDFTTTFSQTLTVGERWEVAVAQVHLPQGRSHFKEAFQREFPSNPVLGQLKTFFKPCIRRELLKFKLANQNSASGENCAIRGYVKSLHSDWLDRRTFAQRSLVYSFLRSNAERQKIRIVLFLHF